MTKLYELSQSIQGLKQLEQEDEIDEQTLTDTMESLQLAFEEKAEAITKLLKNISAPIKAIDEEIKRLQLRKKAILNSTERIKNYLKINMEAASLDVIKTDLITIRLQNSPESVEIIDDNSIPTEYKRTKIIIDIDKNKLKQDLKAGKSISGAKLIKKKHIRFY